MESEKMIRKLETLKTRLESAGLQVEYNHVINAAGNQRPILVVHHDYYGPYPTAETWNTINTVRNIADRSKAQYRLEDRGYHTATFIYPMEA